MKIEYDPAIQADEALFMAVQQATSFLQDEARDSLFWDTTSARWMVVKKQTSGPGFAVALELTNGNAQVRDGCPASWLKDMGGDYARGLMIHSWGNLLEAISREQRKSRPSPDTSASHLDGDEALERILDRVAEYGEREGHSPNSLKLPMRYATALMKLGPTYWGDYYRQIRESGLKAFEGQTLLGMRVELVPGADASIELR